MDWIKYFIIEKTNISITVNGLESIIDCDLTRRYAMYDNEYHFIYAWHTNGKSRFIEYGDGIHCTICRYNINGILREIIYRKNQKTILSCSIKCKN